MKKFLLSVVALAALTVGPAIAADIPRKAPIVKAPPPAPVWTWTGFYSGTNVGGIWTRQEADWPFRTPATLQQFFDHDHDSGIWGSHVGVQIQVQRFVFGVEAAYSTTFSSKPWETGTPNSGCPNPAFTCQAALNRLFTVGPRLGYTPIDNWLLYVTGGYASAQIRSRSFLTATGAIFDDVKDRQNGWFFGGGIEYVLAKNAFFGSDIVIGVEYQHIDIKDKFFLSPGDPPGVLTDARNISSEADIVRGRITFLHHWFSSPISARY